MGKTLQCRQCGAPLRPEAAVNGFVTCEYCGIVTNIQPESSQQDPTAPPSSAPQILIQPDNLAQSVGTGFKTAAIIGAVFTILVPLGIGLLIYSMANKNIQSRLKATLSNHTQGGPKRVPGSRSCLVRLNKDDIADIALLMSPERYKKAPVRFHFFDGVTGKHMGQSPILGTLAKPLVACLGPGYVGVQGQDLKLRIISAQSPDKVVSVLLPDRLDKIAVGDDCARIETSDSAITQIRLSTGETTRCEAGTLHRHNETPGMPTFEKERTFQVGQIRYLVKSKRRGIPFLTISARKGSKRLWSWKLDVTATKFGIPAVITPNTLLVVGAAYPEKDFAYLGGFALSTGRKRFAVRLRTKSIATFGTSIQYNGKWILLCPFEGFAAFDPDSGKLAWKIP